MFCPNCGAKLEDSQVTCPYCGTVNPAAAESDYMHKLEHLKQNVKDLENVPQQDYVRNLKRHGVFTSRIIIIILCILFLLFLIGFSFFSIGRHLERKELQKENAFMKEYFPELNTLYTSGDDEKVYIYLNSLYELDGSSALYRWKHMDYFNYYTLYMDVKNLSDTIADGTSTEYDVNSGFYSAMVLTREELPEYASKNITEAEHSKLTAFTQESEQLLLDYFHLSSKEADQVYNSCLDNGYLSYKKCQKYISESKDQFS